MIHMYRHIIHVFSFSLFHNRADDEALISILQSSLFLVASPMLVKSMFFSFRSSLALSIPIFLCLLCFSFTSRVHGKLRLVVFLPPSVPHAQTTGVFYS